MKTLLLAMPAARVLFLGLGALIMFTLAQGMLAPAVWAQALPSWDDGPSRRAIVEFAQRVSRWTATATHPRFHQPYTSMVFQPMLELLAYLRANGFKTFIVSDGEVEFMRVWSQRVYGIPPEQVIGSTVVTEFQLQDGKPVLMRTPKLNYNDDGPGKPVSINRFTGRQPVFAFGNSDGDLQMLLWTVAGNGKRFAGLVHHTDAKGEWAYDRQSKIGHLDKALDEAGKRSWTVVDMAKEWKRIYPFDSATGSQ